MPSNKKPGKAISRRQFLGRTALATAGAIGFPAIIPSSAYGVAGHIAPSNRIVMGFIGVGKQGKGSHLGRMASRKDVQVVALSDVETGRLEECNKLVNDIEAQDKEQPSYKGCEMYGDFRELIAREDIDAVLIATPDHWHAIPCIMAANSGKDIYCEKPMTRTIHEGRAVVNAVRRHDRVFQTGSQQRSEYSSRFIRAAELVRNGVIGDIQSVDIGVGGPPSDSYNLPPEPVPPTLDWDMWQGPAPWRPYNSELCPLNYGGYPHWRYFRDYAGGSLSDFGAHHFDIAQWALGMDDTGPVEIIPPDGTDVKRLVFHYANGIPMYHGGAAACVFHGTKGTIFVSRSYLRAEPESILETPLGPDAVHLNRNKGHHNDWIDCIRERSRPVADVEIGHRTNSVCQLANIAYVLKRPLKWDPDKEEFPNDDEANRMLSRPMRSPWRL
jgi:predicted dehydrogenase